MAYDIIGDVHGHADRLEALLDTLGFRSIDGAWRHETRSAVFVGDLIDRGPKQRETVALVRAMVDAGSAQMVIGNHEFNAVAYATPHPSGDGYCRAHTDKNVEQHRAFIGAVGFGTREHRSILDWFATLPLWLDLGGVRVVHACWSDRHIDHLESQLDDGALTEQVVIDGNIEGTATFDAIETVLKGPEVHLDGAWYADKEGNPRHAARLRWWDGSATTLRESALVPSDTEVFDADGRPSGLPDRLLSDYEVTPYSDDVPVLFGHYWWRKDSAETINPLATCVDYSVAKDGVLCAYRWDGEAELDPTKFVDA